MTITPQPDTMTVDLTGLGVVRFTTTDGTTVAIVHTDGQSARLNLGVARGQDPARVSLLALLRSAYAEGLLAAWTAADGYDEDGNELEDVREEASPV